MLKYILYLSTFLQHQAQGSICSAFCLLSPAGAQRGTLPCNYTNLIYKSTSSADLWTPHLAELLLSVLQSELFVAMQESKGWWAVSFIKPYYKPDGCLEVSGVKLFSLTNISSCMCSVSQPWLCFQQPWAWCCSLCWLPALSCCLLPGTAHPARQERLQPHTHGKLTRHPMNARTWTLECMNLITGRESKQGCALIFSRKLTLLHFHPSSLLNMQQQQLTFTEVGREGERVKVLNFHQTWTINHNL